VFEPTWESVRTHELPGWYDDAKLGVFLHWGLYSVPGWAPQVPDIQELLRTSGPRRMLRDNPYAEWYANTMQVPGSPTQRHHRETYGDDYPYDNFVAAFDEASGRADLNALADFCRRSGAGYVVLTTKHHEGFTLWPASQQHPVKGWYHARRDLVGELTNAVRVQGLKMGLYYSGGYDWPYNGAVLRRPADAILAVPKGREYLKYVTGHVRELIDRYRPSILWNDISWPSGGNLAELFAYYYNTVEEGVINDRWVEPTLPRNFLTDTLIGGAGDVMQMLWRFIPDSRKNLVFSGSKHYDFRTPEYAQYDRIARRKWESTRGVGKSFGANRNEAPDGIITATELIRSFCDIVSKNGNLLIGVGPTPDGTIPKEQQAPLLGLGEWMAVNREAIVGTRPWTIAESVSASGDQVSFTSRDGTTYALVLGRPDGGTFTVPGLDATDIDEVSMLGMDGPVSWVVEQGELRVEFSPRLPESAAYALRIGPGAKARPSSV
jgi:alpha-L-fucosidase